MAWFSALDALTAGGWAVLAAVVALSYLAGGIPNAYMIVKAVTGEDITSHGTGNVGAMNVRRTTGSWGWFVAAMAADALKGFLPVLAVRLATPATGLSTSAGGVPDVRAILMEAAIIGAVLGHNYSPWLALMKRRFVRTGKGLATGGGALLAYDPVYFAVVVVIGVGTIALTRYMMAGQVAAAFSLPAFALVARRPDLPFALIAGALVYAAHHRRFIGLLRGREPKLYVNDRMGPRG